MLGGFTFQAPLLGSFTEHDTVRSRKVGGAQMQKNREVGGCGGWVGGGGRGGGVTRAKSKICIDEFVAAV